MVGLKAKGGIKEITTTVKVIKIIISRRKFLFLLMVSCLPAINSVATEKLCRRGNFLRGKRIGNAPTRSVLEKVLKGKNGPTGDPKRTVEDAIR